MENPLTFVKIHLTKALLSFGASLHRSEAPLLQSCVGLRSERFFLSQPDLVLVTRAIFWARPFMGHPLLSPIMVLLNPRD